MAAGQPVPSGVVRPEPKLGLRTTHQHEVRLHVEEGDQVEQWSGEEESLELPDQRLAVSAVERWEERPWARCLSAVALHWRLPEV